MKPQSAATRRPDQQEELRDNRQPADEALEHAVEEVRCDALNAPDEYLRDTIVPAGGE
jgi:hypothetical protein